MSRSRIGAARAQDVLLPEARPAKERKALTIDQARKILLEAIPEDRNPAMWLTGLMCGLRPGELAGLRWPYVDIDGDGPAIEVAERAQEVSQKYVGQAKPKTKRSRRRIGLHPLLVAALRATARTWRSSACTTRKASCSAPATAPRSSAEPAQGLPNPLRPSRPGRGLDDL